MSRYQYPRPGNDDEFEEFCLRFYRIFLERDALDRYGKRGERQHGIDLFDQLAIKPAACVQCKHREAHKTLAPAEIKAEVLKAESAPLYFERLIIATYLSGELLGVARTESVGAGWSLRESA